MAIKVNGTTVINDSRALQNVASVDATTAAAITAAGVGSSTIAAATGGTVTTDGDYKVHKFTSNGTFSITTAGPIDYLLVSGGGSGGRGGTPGGGGGGAGGAYLGHLPAAVTANYSIVVGLGGQENTSRGNKGLKSTIIGPQLAINFVDGGGAGFSEYFGGSNLDGASGGGDGYGEPPFGFDGGRDVSGQDGGPSGGGMGGPGLDGNPNSYNGQPGGAGVSYDITGSTVFYAGGGGGGARTTGATGGAGGSGVGGVGGRGTIVGTAPVANSGSGGGGGGGSEAGAPTDGADGVVIFRYKFQ